MKTEEACYKVARFVKFRNVLKMLFMSGREAILERCNKRLTLIWCSIHLKNNSRDSEEYSDKYKRDYYTWINRCVIRLDILIDQIIFCD